MSARVKISGTHWKCIEHFRAIHFIPLITQSNMGVVSGEGALPPPQQRKHYICEINV